ncbi:MAG: hypothetical protein ABSE48_04140 [Verrucomicrobiota bacterium]|jgi:hypothetical protein
MNPDAIIKIKMLRSSQRCLAFGLLGLLPAIGLPFALAALWISGKVRGKEKLYWNAAKPYRIVGMACAAIGAILWSGILILIAGQILWANYGRG